MAKVTKNLSLTVLEQFLRHINNHKLFDKANSVLLAVSGGLDSMVMLDLFKASNMKIGVIHCNFQLRGAESEQDESLVNRTCKDLNIPFHVKRFETEKFAEQNGVSIQMAARELRYKFFNEVMAAHGYAYVATAHHRNDSIETVLLNLVRGTGIEGLTGISVKNGTIIRPMLFATRVDIKNFAEAQQLKWREDLSNASDKYHRNLLRNQVIPLLETINPGFEDSLKTTIERLTATAYVQEQALESFRIEAIRESENAIYINKQLLLAKPNAEFFLWELIKDRGFNTDQCRSIITRNHQSGKVFNAGSYTLTVDRADFIITTTFENVELQTQITDEATTVRLGKYSVWIEKGVSNSDKLTNDQTIANLDLDLIQFPLTWRRWRAGDHFIPLGMKHCKKVSNFLIDSKIPLPEKQNTTVLLSDGEVIWIPGLRIDDRYKITESTKRLLIIKMIKE